MPDSIDSTVPDPLGPDPTGPDPIGSGAEPGVVLISGASGGLAHAVALDLHEQGWRVHGMARNPERAQKLAQVLGPDNVHPGDLREAEVAEQTVQRVLASEARLDALIHGVGTYRNAPLDQTQVSDFEELMATNLFGAVRLVDAARGALRASSGQVLFFGAAGLGSLRARRDTAAYTAAKTALLVYMRSLALQEASHGVRANMISPGVVPHPGAAPDTHDPEIWRSIPLGRPGSPQDIAGAARWLLGARHVTGQNLEVAGGFLL